MKTIRGVFNGNEIELLEDAPTGDRSYVLVTFLEASLERAVAREANVSRDVMRPGLLNQAQGNVYARFTAGALMTREVVTVPGNASVANTSHLMRSRGITSVIVEPNDGGEWGIMTMRDVLKKIIGGDRTMEDATVDEIATRPLTTVTPETSLRECSDLLISKNIRRVAVLQGDTPVGIVSDTDIFQFVEERGWGPQSAA